MLRTTLARPDELKLWGCTAYDLLCGASFSELRWNVSRHDLRYFDEPALEVRLLSRDGLLLVEPEALFAFSVARAAGTAATLLRSGRMPGDPFDSWPSASRSLLFEVLLLVEFE